MPQADSILPPLTERSGIVRWLRKNLIGSWLDAFLTILGTFIIYWVIKGFLTWVFTVAEWEVISANLRLILIGQYPIEQVGRLWIALGFLMFLTGNSLAIWARRS